LWDWRGAPRLPHWIVAGIQRQRHNVIQRPLEPGVRDAASLGEVIRKQKGKRTFTFAIVLELSSQNLNLRKWLRSGGLDPDRDVRTVVIPSALVHETFRAGHLDGYCVAEPWNSAAVLDGSG